MSKYEIHGQPTKVTKCLFQGTDIKLNNSQNEEEEDLEEQRRRNEEIQNLLMTKLDDFNYDESTINSSTNNSVVSVDEIQNNYHKAINPNEQLKVLYDVRLRELNSMKIEYENNKAELISKIDSLNKKVIIYEGELHQTKISLKNAEELLVEKSSAITDLAITLSAREEQIKNYEKAMEEYHLEINTYQSTINDLQMKLQDNINPFNIGNQKFSSEELQKAHGENIAKLEAHLEQQTMIAKLHEKEKHRAQEELQKYIESEIENKNTINALSKSFDSAQKQCQELINVVEKLTNENTHLHERTGALSTQLNDLLSRKSPLESNNDPLERLKKMLVDKSFQIDSLNCKVRDYEDNIRELLEYRQLKGDVYKQEFQQCDNKDHTKCLLIMQHDIQNYKRTIEDKNQQILTLNSTNRELVEKLEQMLSQTRNDIQNISHKYSLPQLEKMTEDMKKAEEKIKELQEKLLQSEEKRLSLVRKIETIDRNDLKFELEQQMLNNEKEKNDYENRLKKMQKELEVCSAEFNNLKKYSEELINDNVRLKEQLTNMISKNETINIEPDQELKKHYDETTKKLHHYQEKVKSLEEKIEELANTKTLSEGEKYNYELQITDHRNQLNKAENTIENLNSELQALSQVVKEKENIINHLEQTLMRLDSEAGVLKQKLTTREHAIEMCEKKKTDLEQLLEEVQSELVKTKEQVIDIRKEAIMSAELPEVMVVEKNIRRNLEKEMLETEMREAENKEYQVDVLTIEIKLREEIQKEYLKKLSDIEKKYKKVCASSNDLYKGQVEMMKNQEGKYREHIATIIRQCTHKIKELEKDKEDLIDRINILHNEFTESRKQMAVREENFRKILSQVKVENKENEEKWKLWSQKFLNNCLDIESSNKKIRDNILFKMQTTDSEVLAMEKSYNEKIKKYVKNCKM
ncbi:unnamed protein product [Phaedon cochleariae]|uniref:Uncharacterized protein n=1 Tax=Phaedon cochleariae TaxID=80249 RepID=A0A9N9SEW8_PHACE|nr:unnamed protein product [Phaedon cochleariae]